MNTTRSSSKSTTSGFARETDAPGRTIKLPVYGITVNLGDHPGDGAGSITSDLHEEGEASRDYNLAMDGIESMILAHAVAGVDVESPAYLEGIETAVEACANNLLG